MPLTAGIAIAVLSSSLLLLIPLSLIGGMIFGPFLAGMFDSIMRGLRNEPGQWLRSWKRSWKQNARDSILPGALTGLVIGLYVFMGFVMWWSVTGPTFVTILLYLISALIFLTVSLLFWPQLVLFSQTPRQTLVNILLFSAKYLWRVLGAAAVVLFFTAIMVLFCAAESSAGAGTGLLVYPFSRGVHFLRAAECGAWDRGNTGSPAGP